MHRLVSTIVASVTPTPTSACSAVVNSNPSCVVLAITCKTTLGNAVSIKQ